MSPRPVARLRRPRFRGIRTPVATPRQSAVRLAGIGIGSALLVAPLWYLTTQTEAGQHVADVILFGRVLAAPEVLGAAQDTLATVTLVMAAIAALGLATLALARGGPGLLAAVGASLLGANVTSQLLEAELGRPNLLGDAAYAVGNSFPSGHTALVASLAFAALLVVPRSLRTPAAILAAVAIAAVGTSTIVAGWHRLADVVGAILIALAWTTLATALLVIGQGWMPRRTWRRGLGGAATGTAAFVGAATMLAGGFGLAAAVMLPAPIAEPLAAGAGTARTFVAAVTISAGAGFVAVAALLWALRGVALELPRPLPDA
jgi:membrane-associated phospholipid phosphatase